MRGVALIGAASGWGAGFRATEEGPEGLRAFGLAERLQEVGVPARWAAMVETERRWRGSSAPTTQEVFDMVARHAHALSSPEEGD